MLTSIPHQLIIQVGLQEFTFAVKNSQNHKITHLKHFELEPHRVIEQQLEAIFDSNEILSSSFNQITVLHDNALHAFVPEEFFDENSLGNYLQFSTKVYSTDTFDFDKMESLKAFNVYIPFAHFNNFLLDKFGEFTFKHKNSLLLENVFKNIILSENVEVCIHLSETEFQIVVGSKENLIFFNSFNHQTKEDFIYYILFVFEQFELNPNEINVKLLGCISSSSDYFSIAYKYIRNLFVLSNPEDSNFLEISENDYQKHYILLHS